MSATLKWSVPLLLALSACAGPPPSPSLGLSPESPTTTDDLVLDITDDAELDVAVAYTVTWYRDGEEVTELADATTVPAAETAKGQAWKVQVAAVDDKERTSETVDLVVTIINTAPTAAVEVAPEAPATDDDLVATATGQDVDDDALTYAYTWQRDGADAGVSTDTVPGSMTAKGEVWTVQVVPNDGETTGPAVEASVSVANSAPVVDSVTLTPTEAYETSTVTAEVVGSDADGDTVTWAYTWSVDGVVVDGVDGASITGTDFDKGSVIAVQVTPNDGLVDGVALTSDELIVLNTVPTVERAVINPTAATEDATLTCAGSNWIDPDGDAEDYRTSWEVDEAVVSTEPTLTGVDFDKGDSVVCVLTPWDGEAEGTPVASNPVVVDNSPPVLTSVTISPADPKEGDTLTISLGSAVDIDGDSITYAYEWFVAGSSAGTSDTLDSDSFDKDQEITVVVTPNDGEDDGAGVTSNKVTAANSAPEIASAAVSPSTLYTATTALAAVSGVTDADSDTVTLTYDWYVDGSSVGVTTSSLSGSYFSKGEEVRFVVTADDGTDTTSVTSAAVEVSNTAPSAPGVSIDPASPKDADTLLCSIDTAASDADRDTLSYDIDWYKDGTLWTGSTSTTNVSGDTIAASDTSVGDEWECYAAAYDGTDYGPDGKSGVETIAADFAAPAVGTTGTAGRIAGDSWIVCRADSSTAWVAANTSGTYNTTTACASLGYIAANARGGTCGTVCGYCGTAGREYYDGSGGSYTSLQYTVHWRCYR